MRHYRRRGDSHSNLAGQTLEALQFRRLYKVNPLAIVRGEAIIMDDINVTKLIQGDTLLLYGRWEQFRLIAEKMDISYIKRFG